MDGRSEIEMEILLSAWRDGELSPEEAREVEEAMARDPRLKARAEDHAALGAFLRASLEQEADRVDFSGFADAVMARLPRPEAAPAPTPAPTPSLWERFTGWLDETLRFHRLQFAAGLAAVVALLVAVPLLWDAQRIPPASIEPQGTLLAGSLDMAAVIDIATPEDTDAMLYQTASGTTVIYVQGNMR